MKQTNFFKEENKEDENLLVFSKQVKRDKINFSLIDRVKQVKEIINIINSLLKLGEKKNLNEIELKENCKLWITSLINDYPNVDKKDAHLLLNDFTDSMKTNMRVEEKYAICIIFKHSLLLCHSKFGEKTVTENWKVVKRMIDKDNIMRFAFFFRGKNGVKVIFYELFHSESFAEWLGLPEKEVFYYLGGRNRIYTDIAGVKCVFELTDKEIEKQIIEGKIEISDNQMVLPSPIERLSISQIRVSKKRYNNFEDFLQDFIAKTYEINHYQREYRELKSSLKPLFTKFVDDEEKVTYIGKGEEKVFIRKRNPNFVILFVDKDIEIRSTFIQNILTKILNRQTFKVFHAGVKFSPTPLKIGKMEVFNECEKRNVVEKILFWYNNTNIIDSFLNRTMIFSIFNFLSLINSGNPLSYFFKEVTQRIKFDYHHNLKISKFEDDIIEYKSRDFFAWDNKKIVKKLSNAIKKMRKNNFKIYLIGIDENSRLVEPIPLSRTHDSRLNDLVKLIKKNVKIRDIYPFKIPLSSDSCIIVLIVIR